MKAITTISPIEIFDTFITSGNATFFKIKLFEHDIKEIKNAIKVLKENTHFNRIAIRFDAIPQTLDENYKPVEWEFEMDSVELVVHKDGQVYLTGYIGDIRFESKPLSLDKPRVYVHNLQDIEKNLAVNYVPYEGTSKFPNTIKVFNQTDESANLLKHLFNLSNEELAPELEIVENYV